MGSEPDRWIIGFDDNGSDRDHDDTEVTIVKKTS